MNKKTKFAISGFMLAVFIVLIIHFQSNEPQQMEILKPPSAILRVGEVEQVSGIGSYCWNESDKILGLTMRSTSICADREGIHTPFEPLLSNSTFTAHLSLPLKEPPRRLQLNVIRVTDDDEIILSFADDRAWSINEKNRQEGNYTNLIPATESDINFSLKSGLYVLEVGPIWKEKGNVSYGFLLKVQ